MASACRGVSAAGIAAATLLALPLFLFAGGDGIFLPGTQPADGSGDPAFPPFIDDTVTGPVPGTLDRPGACDNCHQNYRSTGQQMYEPWDTWSGSMMANSARDPLFWAALDIANQDDAELGDVGVGDFCLRCHVPKAWYEGRSTCDTPWGESFDGSCLDGSPDVPDNDFEGILCSVCHRSYDASNPPPGQFFDPLAPYAGNAQLYLSTAEREMLGPLSDAQPLGHTFRHSPFHRESAFCGQCHDVTHPSRNRRDPDTGADLGYPMPIERTWSEYAQSRIGDPAAPEFRTCQQCHMPEPDLDGDGLPDPAYACSQAPGLRGQGTALEGPLRMHVFAGANTWMLGLLSSEYGAALDREAEFANAIAASLKLLQESTVDLDLTAPASVIAGDVLPLDVRVTNLAGHKFPTGYPEGRRAWIAVTVGEDRDGDGLIAPEEIVFESGAYDEATGRLERDGQIRVYEAKPGVFNRNGTGECDVTDGAGREIFHFVLNDCWKSDNRIPPLGFVPNDETRPVGVVYPANPALPGTLAHWDDHAVAVPVPLATTADLIVDVRVRYQSASSEYLGFLRDENRSTCDPFDELCDPTQPDARLNRGEKMHGLWERSGRSAPVDVAIARASVAILVPPPSACCVVGACSDLEPAACVALEGTFLAGDSCSSFPCPPAVVPGEASDVSGGAAPLLVRKAGGGMLDVRYDPACDATDHALIAGPLSGVSTLETTWHDCLRGVSGATSFAPGAGSWWMLVAGLTDAAEGSYGRDSGGAERPQRVGSGPCDRPQDLSPACR